MSIVAPYLPYEKLRCIADDFLREHHHSGELPISIEDIIEFDFKLDIVPMPGLKDEFDVDAFITNDLTEIRVDQFIQQRYPNRYRFSLAHELAHILIHQDIFKALQFSTVAEWKVAMQLIPDQVYSLIEWQAYSLGGLMLVPTQPLAEIFASRAIEAKQAGIDLKEIDSRLRRTVHSNIGRFFGVSADVIERRAHFDKLWQ